MIQLNVSHTNKAIWWGPTRTGSRSVGAFLRKVGNFKLEKFNTSTGLVESYSDRSFIHGTFYPPYVKGYALIVNTRNPYAREVSLWSLFKTRMTEITSNTPSGHSLQEKCMFWMKNAPLKKEDSEHFITYLSNISFEDYVNNQLWMFEPDKQYSLDFEFVKAAYDMQTYVLKLETIDKDILSLPFINLEDSNTLAAYNDHILSNTFKSNTNNFTSYYNENLAQKIYAKHKHAFEYFGYSKDSWKIGRVA